MKSNFSSGKHKTIIVLTLLTLFTVLNASAQIPITYYDFESNSARSTTSELTPEQTVNPAGNVSLVGVTASTGLNGAGTLYGSTASGSSIGGSSWQGSASDPGASPTAYFLVNVNTSNFTGITLSYDYRVSAAGPQGNGVVISDGINTSVLAGTTVSNNAAFNSISWSLGNIANNKSSLTLKIYFYKGTNAGFASTGTARIDNLTIKATTLTGGTVNLLDEDAYYAGLTSGSSGKINEKNFTVTGSNTTCRLSNSGIQMDTLNTFLVTAGATLDCGQTASATMKGNGTFQLDAGCTLLVRSPNGINATSTSGNIQTLVRNYNASANYTFQHFSGTAQSLGGGVPSPLAGTLTINNSGGVTLTSKSLKISGTLNMLNGRLSLDVYNLTLVLGSTLNGTFSATTMVCPEGTGELRREITANNSLFFPIGDASGTPEYSPITANFTSGTYTSTAYCAVRLVNSKHPNNLSSTNYINRYWVLRDNGISSFSTSLTMNYTDADVVGNESLMQPARWTSYWSRSGTITAATNTITRTTTLFGDYSALSSVAPTVSISGNTSPLCEGNTATLLATPAGDGPFSYLWSPNGVTTADMVSDPYATNDYTVTVTDGNGLTASVTSTVTVNPAANVYAGIDQEVCANATIVLDGYIWGGATSATWSTAGDGTFSNASAINSNYVPGPGDLATGYAVLTLTSNSAAAPCVSVNDAMIVYFIQIPTVTGVTSNVTCHDGNNGSVDATVVGGLSPYSYSWTNGASTQDISALTDQSYSLVVTDANNCSVQTSFLIGADHQNPMLVALATPSSVCIGLTSQLSVSGASSYAWVTSSELSADTGSNVVASPTASTTYTVTGQDDYGCFSSAAVSVTVVPYTSDTLNETICDSYTWNANNTVYTESGSYTYVNGCNTSILNLIVLSSSSNITSASSCDEFIWSVDGVTYTTSGVYTSISGCNTEILNLTITPSSDNLSIITACDAYVWTIDGVTYTESGLYTSVNGCNTEILDLDIIPSSSSTTIAAACDEFFWNETGITYTASGNYSTTTGCVTDILDLTITTSTNNSTIEYACDSYTWSEDGITYTTSGVYTFISGCHTEILDLTINSCPNGVTLQLTAFIQGLYAGTGTMQSALFNSGVLNAVGTDADSMVVELRDSLDPTNVVATTNVLLLTDGSATANFSTISSGVSYWIVLKHRNSIETWSASEVLMAATTSYDFTTADSQAFGGNLVEMEQGVWALYTGDINQDEYVDNYDYPPFDSDNLAFSVGYLSTDLNGDGFVDNYDYPVYDNNNINFITSIHP